MKSLNEQQLCSNKLVKTTNFVVHNVRVPTVMESHGKICGRGKPWKSHGKSKIIKSHGKVKILP